MLCGNITPWDFICILVNAAQSAAHTAQIMTKLKIMAEIAI
jgi:hypothetical protein